MDEHQNTPQSPQQPGPQPTQPLAQQPGFGTTPPPPDPQPTELTGAQKFGWFVVGLVVGLIPGALIASLTNIGKPYRSDCTKFAVIGGCILCIIAFLLISMIVGLTGLVTMME